MRCREGNLDPSERSEGLLFLNTHSRVDHEKSHVVLFFRRGKASAGHFDV